MLSVWAHVLGTAGVDHVEPQTTVLRFNASPHLARTGV